jgi:hypothetical protein
VLATIIEDWSCGLADVEIKHLGSHINIATHQYRDDFENPLLQDVPSTTMHIPPRAFTYDVSAFILQQSSKPVVVVL